MAWLVQAAGYLLALAGIFAAAHALSALAGRRGPASLVAIPPLLGFLGLAASVAAGSLTDLVLLGTFASLTLAVYMLAEELTAWEVGATLAVEAVALMAAAADAMLGYWSFAGPQSILLALASASALLAGLRGTERGTDGTTVILAHAAVATLALYWLSEVPALFWSENPKVAMHAAGMHVLPAIVLLAAVLEERRVAALAKAAGALAALYAILLPSMLLSGTAPAYFEPSPNAALLVFASAPALAFSAVSVAKAGLPRDLAELADLAIIALVALAVAVSGLALPGGPAEYMRAMRPALVAMTVLVILWQGVPARSRRYYNFALLAAVVVALATFSSMRLAHEASVAAYAASLALLLYEGGLRYVKLHHVALLALLAAPFVASSISVATGDFTLAVGESQPVGAVSVTLESVSARREGGGAVAEVVAVVSRGGPLGEATVRIGAPVGRVPRLVIGALTRPALAMLPPDAALVAVRYTADLVGWLDAFMLTGVQGPPPRVGFHVRYARGLLPTYATPLLVAGLAILTLARELGREFRVSYRPARRALRRGRRIRRTRVGSQSAQRASGRARGMREESGTQ